jgi:putative hemolysin
MLIGLTACSEESRNKYELERQQTIDLAKVKCFASGGAEFVVGKSGGSDHEVCVYKACIHGCFMVEDK